jgi:multisubunit Na+/H+ antiporter MnhB subunit
MIDILLGIIMFFVLMRVPGLPKVGLLIVLGLLYLMNRRRKMKPQPQEVEDQDKDVVTLSKDQYKVN